MRYFLITILALLLIALGGCGGLGWFASGAAAGAAVSDAAKQAQERSVIIEAIMKDPNMMALIIQAAGSGIIAPDQQEIIMSAIDQYQQLHGTAAIIRQNAKEPGWWVAFGMGLIAAYQKYQRGKGA